MNDLEILLPKYFAGEATPEERQAVADWSKASDENEALLDFYQKLWSEGKFVSVKTYDARAAWTKIAGQTSKQPETRIVDMKNAWRWMLLAAAVFSAVVFSVQFFSRETTVDEQWQELAAGTAVKQVELPDGTLVWLNQDAKIWFPRLFSGDQRSIRLQGEAFFEVASDSSKPFIIQSEYVDVTVLGTSFNFSAGKKEAEITVASGKVKLQAHSGGLAILEKGEKGLFDDRKKTLVKTTNLDPNFYSWKTGVFEFDGTEIRHVIKSLNTFYRQKPIVYKSNAPNGCALSTRFEGAGIEAVLDVLCATCDLRWAEQKDQYEVIPK